MADTCNLTTRCEIPYPDIGADDWGADYNAKIQLSDALIASLQVDNDFVGNVSVTGAMSVTEYLYHYKDTGANTYLRFREDRVGIVAGAVNFIDIVEDTQDKIDFNPDGGDVDYNFYTASSLLALGILGETGLVSCLAGLSVIGSVDISQTATYASNSIACYSTENGHYPYISFRKSDNATIGTKTETDTNDVLGVLDFVGVGSSSDWSSGAYIKVLQSGVAGASNIPTNMEFYTSTNAATAKRMKIDSTGLVSCLAGLLVDGRIQGDMGADIAMADDITLGDGNFFKILTPAELVTNGVFASGDNWFLSGAGATISAGKGHTVTYDTDKITSTASIPLVTGKTYLFSVTLSGMSGPNALVKVRPFGVGGAAMLEETVSNGDISFSFVATGTAAEIVLSGTAADWDNASIKIEAAVNRILTTGWQAGSEISLWFECDTLLRYDETAGSGYAGIIMLDEADHTVRANSIVDFIYDGTYWREKHWADTGS